MEKMTGIQPFTKWQADNYSSYKGFVNGKDMTFGEFIEHSIENKRVCGSSKRSVRWEDGNPN